MTKKAVFRGQMDSGRNYAYLSEMLVTLGRPKRYLKGRMQKNLAEEAQ